MTEQEKDTIRIESALMTRAVEEAKKERTAIERHIEYFVNGALLMFENYTALQQRIKDFDKHIENADSSFRSMRDKLNAALERNKEQDQ